VYDPSDYDIPGSFGIIYTNRTFLQQFPSAAQDFMRATMKGLADAIADPAAAAAIAVDAINANGNTMFLSPEGETARWGVESELVGGSATAGQPAGLPLLDLLQAEVDTYAGIGLFADGAPTVADLVDTGVLKAVYGTDGKVIWPSEG